MSVIKAVPYPHSYRAREAARSWGLNGISVSWPRFREHGHEGIRSCPTRVLAYSGASCATHTYREAEVGPQNT